MLRTCSLPLLHLHLTISPSHLQLPLHRLPASSPQNHITVLKRACTQFLGVRWLFKLAAVHQPSTTQRADERGGTGRMWVRRCGEFGLYYLNVNTRVASPQMWLPFCAQINEHFSPRPSAGANLCWGFMSMTRRKMDFILHCAWALLQHTTPRISADKNHFTDPGFPSFFKIIYWKLHFCTFSNCFKHRGIYSYDY